MTVRFEETFDFRNPDYVGAFRARAARLQWLNETPEAVAPLKAFYRENPGQFINDWGMTFDPRNADLKLPTVVPFILFKKQFEWVDWFMARWRGREDGVTEKSRDMGISWLALSTAATVGLLNPNIVIGFGSRDEDSVDLNGSPDSLFWKARFFIKHLPVQFREGWDEKKHSAHMRISLPSGSSIVGDAGKNIGRGGRASIYVVDEAAHLANPVAAEAALSQTTNCRIYVSSVNGRGNPFAEKRFSGKVPVFTFHWKSDPRKDDEWYAAQCDKLDPVTVAQEIDINYNASAEGILIPADWINAAVDAHIVLGIEPTGRRVNGFDVADEGKDKLAVASRKGILLDFLEEWRGVGSDIFASVVKAAGIADDLKADETLYDADGLGAGVRGDARVMNEARKKEKLREVTFLPFRGSGEVLYKERTIPTAAPKAGSDKHERKNKDFFANAKAQSYWGLRVRFQRTFRAVQLVKQGQENPYDPDSLISLSSLLPNLDGIKQELSQPTYAKSLTGKIVVDKDPDGTASPNKSDSIMIAYSLRKSNILDGFKGT